MVSPSLTYKKREHNLFKISVHSVTISKICIDNGVDVLPTAENVWFFSNLRRLMANANRRN